MPVLGVVSAFVKDWIPLIDEYHYCTCVSTWPYSGTDCVLSQTLLLSCFVISLSSLCYVYVLFLSVILEWIVAELWEKIESRRRRPTPASEHICSVCFVLHPQINLAWRRINASYCSIRH